MTPEPGSQGAFLNSAKELAPGIPEPHTLFTPGILHSSKAGIETECEWVQATSLCKVFPLFPSLEGTVLVITSDGFSCTSEFL